MWRKNFKQFRADDDHWRERAESLTGSDPARTGTAAYILPGPAPHR